MPVKKICNIVLEPFSIFVQGIFHFIWRIPLTPNACNVSEKKLRDEVLQY